jgi:arylsulfatase A-like enzyme
MTQKQKSIVLITVDCLRADHVGFMGYSRPTTPFLDSLAKESSVVPAAIVAGAPTYYSLSGIHASRFPLAFGRDILGIAPDETTIASVVKEAGYTTAAFSAANPYISSRFGYDRGFDTFRDFLDSEAEPLPATEFLTGGWASRVNRNIQKVSSALGPLGSVYDELYFRYCQRKTPVPPSIDDLRRFPSADLVVEHARAWLGNVGATPFFLWLHLMDPHSPYFPKPEALALMGGDRVSPRRARYLNSFWNRSDLGSQRLARHRDDVISLYDAGIRWADEQMKNLVATLRESKHWDDCIFALTADHGEEFLEHGGRYHPPTGLMEELIHVPLMFRVPGSVSTELSRSPFSQIHLGPTLLEAAGVRVPNSFEGRSRWQQFRCGQSADDIAISECVAGCTNPFRAAGRLGSRVLSVRDSRFKLVLFFESRTEYLYDVEADPGEKSPLPSGSEPRVRRRLLEAAREHLRGSSDRRDSQSRVKARLRELQLEWKKPADKASPVAS